jgi:bifunctional non-homologous end joining protein LigD
LSEPLPGTPAQIEAAVRALGLEGVVAKRRDSRYEPGKRSDAWIKVKFNRRQEFVIGGYKPAAPSFDSVLVGYYQGRQLFYAGKVRAGFTPHARADVFRAIAPLETARCPFVNLPNARSSHWGEGITGDDMKSLRWVRPRIVVEVAFTEWTRDGNLRHSSFAGVRTDKAAKDVVREG